ncbi:MAG TPA: PBP1A family penicillin-binding protein [Desulfomonilaceae bacterium]|nr:PBP1A family penicillin-binding protein [Desulfomonilaceae bacterium]
MSSHGNKKTGVTAAVIAWLGAGLPVLILCASASGLAGAALGCYLAFSADLPNIPDLQRYRPKTVSTFYAEDGTVIGLFYKEKRFPIPIDSIPPHVVNSFLAAEDARFYTHTGIDVFGVLRAIIKNVQVGNFAQGGSTITQQVTRNFLLSKEKKLSRKIREAILSYRLEKTLSKKQILELYLNEIYLGKGAYGIEAAARTYFAKSTCELSIAESALLAGLVANPTKYSPQKNPEGALKRREFVLGGMLRHSFISEEEHRTAEADILNIRDTLPNPYERVPYFTEGVRQYIVAKYGEKRLYNEGLQVWTTCDVALQKKASDSLLLGVTSWEKREGRPAGLIRRLKPSEAREFLEVSPDQPHHAGDLLQAVVITNHTQPKKNAKTKQTPDPMQDCTLALAGNRQFRMSLRSDVRYRSNDLLEFKIVEADGGRLTLEHNSLPPVEGALVCIENNTGYIRALAGGLDFDRSNFNRANQALRQPGSAFKPLVYAAALEWSQYSPNTLVVDDPIAVVVDPRVAEWLPMNSDGQFQGPMTLRQALATSRNIVAVKLLMDVGIEPAVQMARKLGIQSPLGKNLSLSLGSSEVTPLELTAAYTVFPNMGIKVNPVMVKKVVDRFGNVLEDNTAQPLDPAARIAEDAAKGEMIPAYDTGNSFDQGSEDSGLIDEMRNLATREKQTSGETAAEKVLVATFPPFTGQPRFKRVLSPQTSYLMASMLRDVCVSGTAATAARLKRTDLAGKTGTTDDCTDAWFVGFNPKFTTGVWMGYDAKVSLGRQEYGATAALPVWMDFMKDVLRQQPVVPYPLPPGIVFAGGPGQKVNALLEAGPDFEPDTSLKQVSPVDATFLPSSGQQEFVTGMPLELVQASATYQPDAVRILSVTGETLGFGSYTRDQKGKLTLYAHYPVMQDEVQDRTQADGQPEESYVQGAARFLRRLPQFIAPYSGEGWLQ